MEKSISVQTKQGLITASIVENPDYPGIEIFLGEGDNKLYVALVECPENKLPIAVRTWDATNQGDDPRESFDVLNAGAYGKVYYKGNCTDGYYKGARILDFENVSVGDKLIVVSHPYKRELILQVTYNSVNNERVNVSRYNVNDDTDDNANLAVGTADLKLDEYYRAVPIEDQKEMRGNKKDV